MKLKIPFEYDNLKKIDLGLTNDNYHLDINEQTYIIRIPKDDLKNLFNRKHEAEVLESIKDQDFTLNPFYYEDGIQIVAYEEKLLNFEDYHKDDKILKTANLMKTFFDQKISVSFNFDPLKQIEIYENYSDNLEINLNDYQDLFNAVSKIEFTPQLCHNDWVDGNICFIDDDVYLIDFEYAGNNDIRFDIMSFLTENDLSNDEKSEFLGYMYPKGISDEEAFVLALYRDLNNVLWYLWAMMMFNVRDEIIYREIADIKLKQLKEEYKKPLKF